MGHTPPPFQEVHKLVLTWLLLWIDKRFVCDPPKVNHHAFDVRTLGKYSARYHELSLLRTESSDDNPNGIKAERLVFPAQEWTPGVLKPVSQPITKPWTHDRGAASTSKLQVDCNNANVENKPSSGTSTPKSSKKAAKPTVRDLGDLLRPARAVRPAPAHHRAD